MSIFTQERQRRAEAELEAQRRAAKQVRDQALQAITHTFADGAVVQVRPQDISNFSLAVQQGQPQEWVMADNSVRLTTVEEMQAALADGIAQGAQVWSDYTAALKEL